MKVPAQCGCGNMPPLCSGYDMCQVCFSHLLKIWCGLCTSMSFNLPGFTLMRHTCPRGIAGAWKPVYPVSGSTSPSQPGNHTHTPTHTPSFTFLKVLVCLPTSQSLWLVFSHFHTFLSCLTPWLRCQSLHSFVFNLYTTSRTLCSTDGTA